MANSPLIFNGNDAKLLNAGYLRGKSGSVYPQADEKSYTTNWGATASWTSSGGTMTTAVETTSANLPRANTSPSGIKFSSGASADYQYYGFTVDQADYNTKLKVQFAMTLLSGTSSDFKVQVFSGANHAGATALSLSTDASGTTLLPNATLTFRTTFDTLGSASNYVEVRITRANSSTSQLVISDLIVGPSITPQGDVIGEWTSWTPTLSTGVRGTNTEQAYWRRVGSEMEIHYTYVQTAAGTAGSGVYKFSLPSGYTIDTGKVTAGGGSSASVVGNSEIFNGTTEYNSFVIVASTTHFSFVIFTAATTPADAGSANISFGNTTLRIFGNARIPISEWQGSGTVNVVQNDVEYAWNSNTANASDTSSFGYGPGGVVFGSYASSERLKRVRFLTPIQATDFLILEVQATSTSNWMDITYTTYQNGIGVLRYQNGISYGLGLGVNFISATDVDVSFGLYATASATYGGAGGAWSSFTAYRWRLKKVSSGSAVGFGEVQPAVSSGLVSASGLKGRTDGNALASSYVGQILSDTATGSVSLTSNTPANAATLSITAGVWLVWGGCEISSSATMTQIISSVSSTSATLNNSRGASSSATLTTSNFNDCQLNVTPMLVNISATTTYYLVARAAFASGTASATNGFLFAVRIA